MYWYHKNQRERLSVIRSQGGETLLELVISIGLFAITMLMVAVMFAGANRTTEKNFRTEVEMDQAVSDIVKEENIHSRNNFTVTFQKTGGAAVSKDVERIETQGLYKFRENP